MRIRDRRSVAAQAYRRLYKSARWLSLRLRQLAINPLCAYCLKRGHVRAATAVDHKTPHKGDLRLFFDETNLQSLCETCHNSVKQREERGQTVIFIGPDGWPEGV